MPDVFTKAKRSEVMSRIRGHGNKATELALAKLFRAHGITGWRRRQQHLGKPDFTFRRERVVVFVDGCFWHGCPKHFNMPVNNRSFWEKKLTTNKTRDKFVTRALRKSGWRVLRIWEHDLTQKPLTCIFKIKSALAKAAE
jgi:DNA mismatch endonuclease (patch repair protein)